MKKIFSILSVCLCMLFMASCQSDNEFADGNYGYLRLAVGVNTSTNVSRAGEEVTYNPKQIAVQIINASGEVVKETDNWENWNNVQVALPVGTYSLKASSAGFDGQTSAFDKPYYAGSTEFTITKNAEVNATVTCTLANVKVSVIFDESFKSKFKSATVTVGSLETSSTIGDLEFVMGENDTQSAYFPVVDLKAKLAVVNMAGYSFSQTDNIEGVAARDHYILKYQLAEEGKGDVNITVDPSSKTYTYTFNVTTEPSTTLSVDKANAWSNFASLSGSILTSETLDATKVAFEYKLKDASEWTKVAATAGSANTYTAKATGLTPNSSYDFRMVYGEEEYVSGASTFTTEGAKALPNGSFDDWYKDDKVIYACSEADYAGNSINSFWDSGNAGAATMNKNPTQGNSENVHTAGGMSAELKSQFVGVVGIGKFAAGNLYAGHYLKTYVSPMGARIGFGREFSDRPTQLTGWFKYTRGTEITHGKDPYKAELTEQGGDKCAIYVALTDNDGREEAGVKVAYIVDNSQVEPYDDQYTIPINADSPDVIAYGSITDAESVGTGEWQQFTIDLKYNDLTRKPKFIIIVVSASKYGDYFTGSKNSVMYIDDFSLVYGNEPVTK